MSVPGEEVSAEVDALLARLRAGEPAASEALFVVVQSQLRKLARRWLGGQRPGHVLQTTALVNEAALRMLSSKAQWQDHAHFFKVAAAAMRTILIDHARARNAQKRSPVGRRVDLDSVLDQYEARAGDLSDLAVALDGLRVHNKDAAELIELRFFGGRTVEECQRIMGITERAARGLWKNGRAWLKIELEPDS